MTSWVAPRTYTTGEILTKSILDTHVRDNELHLFEQIHSGTSTPGWASYTPTLTNITIGDGSVVGKYGYAGNTTFFRVLVTFGSTTSVGGSVSVSLPQTAVNHGVNYILGNLRMLDATGSTYMGVVLYSSTTTVLLKTFSVSGSSIIEAVLSSTVPFTWATSDLIEITGHYERA